MKTDKEIKKEFRKIASKDPDKYYATKILKESGFSRQKCSKCSVFFWKTTKSKVCGDAACSGGFKFIGNTPAKKKLDYIGVWREFAKLFSKLGYKPIKRYPVAARWRDDTDFVQASIYDFQPWVVSGEVKPPANPLVIPQFCLRFNDIDNVGITGQHYVGFVMIGQHAFVHPKDWDQDKYFSDIKLWLNKGLGLEDKEITFHEDVWAGGGNFGPCMEFFSRGMELGNQVYMMYEQTDKGKKELKLKVLDMGMGHERNAWFTNGTSTSYETTFPPVMEKLYKKTGIKQNKALMKKFIPYAAYLNIDEVDDIDKTWRFVAKKINMTVKELKKEIIPLSALYSVAEHSRALLFALSDGVLPSNVGGGYNLRVILRRALSFIDKYDWDVKLIDVCKWHAAYLKPLFPEVSDHLDDVEKILAAEKRKYLATKENSKRITQNIIKQKITEQKLLQLYDSQGIQPEMIKEEAKKLGKNVEVPEDFYAKISELHEKKVQAHETKKAEKLNLDNVQDTEVLYYNDYRKVKFGAKVVKIINKDVILDRTYFYPTSGGQVHDTGFLNGEPVIDVFKQGNIIVHVMENKPKFRVESEVYGEINFSNRIQLAQHHTSTHIINAAAKQILGNHIYQAGAKKTVEKAHIDITHYENLTESELKKIEDVANEIINKKLTVYSYFLDRTDAEQKYGTSIYQGGAVPGNNLRIVNISDVDVEACGGTHLKNTSEAKGIKIIKSTKIQDGICRIVFTAGKAAKQQIEGEQDILNKLVKILGVKINEIPARSEELFDKWKKARKAVKKKKKIDIKELKLVSKKKYEGDILTETAKIFKTQPEHILKTTERFISEIEKSKTFIKRL
ncbi:alanine--tRNA ligase [Candidatus Woesearchaeota archaeon]|nr:alanine--tRNA ligase [Candidatus Woesearchaeota archaeon]